MKEESRMCPPTKERAESSYISHVKLKQKYSFDAQHVQYYRGSLKEHMFCSRSKVHLFAECQNVP